MPLLQSPVHPLTKDPNPFTAEAAKAKALLDSEVANPTGWEEFESSKCGDDIKLEKKADGGSQIPMVRGSCLIPNVTTDELVPLVQLPGIRKKWDPRFETAWMLRRFTETSYQFYSLGNSPPGLKWLISPRDISGVSQIYYNDSESTESKGKNAEIKIVQTSVKDDERASVQKGCTRMLLSLSGWLLKPVGNDVQATYMVKTDLAGSIPARLVAGVVEDIPICAGKLRDTYHEFGYPPYVLHSAQSPRSTLQSEFFDLGGTKNDVHQPAPNDKTWHCNVLGTEGGNVVVHYDGKKMYKGGLQYKINGDGKDGVTVKDDGVGKLELSIGGPANGKNFEIVVSPKK